MCKKIDDILFNILNYSQHTLKHLYKEEYTLVEFRMVQLIDDLERSLKKKPTKKEKKDKLLLAPEERTNMYRCTTNCINRMEHSFNCNLKNITINNSGVCEKYQSIIKINEGKTNC